MENLNPKSLQADKSIINILKEMGARVQVKEESIIVQKSELKPIKIDVRDFPDLFPTICILCSQAKGRSEISGIVLISGKMFIKIQ